VKLQTTRQRPSTRWAWRGRRRSVHALRAALERRDASLLESLLGPHVAVVVESGAEEAPTIRMVRGAYDAVPLLVHGLASRPGLTIAEREVDGQAGLVIRGGGAEPIAVTVDFTGRAIAALWIRLGRISFSA
jgi:hypothetical protein